MLVRNKILAAVVGRNGVACVWQLVVPAVSIGETRKEQEGREDRAE